MQQHIDTLVNAAWIVPIEPESVVLRDHSLAVNAGKIIDLLPSDVAIEKYVAKETVDLSAHVIMPGLVNTHTHSAMTLLRGYADDLPLMTWLQEHIWPAEGKWVGPEFVRDGTDLAIADMLLGGTTCFNDMYFFPEASAEAAIAAKIRAAVGMIVIEFPSAYATTAADYFSKGKNLYSQFHQNPLLKITLAPHAPYTVSDSSFATIAQLSQDLDLSVNMHVHETAFEVTSAESEHGERPLARLDRLGLLNKRLIAVHMTQLTADEIALCAERGVSVAHCAESNLKLASGFCPVHALVEAGVNVAIGTDGTSSNNDLDMWGELRIASLLAKACANNAAAIPAATILRMATLNGAKALGWDNEIGSLVPGKAADFIAVRVDSLECLPIYNMLSHLAYVARRDHVTDVWIAGERVVKNRQLQTLDENHLRAIALKWQQRISGQTA